jgi:integrase
MSALTYMQRRSSGTYEFRKRLPESLAGKPVPRHMREPFAELVNVSTGRFKRELVRSLETKDDKKAKRQNHRVALQVSEIAQLRVCDVRQDGEQGRWFFDVGRTGGRTTKTEGSIRRIPIHPELVRIGLLRYREGLVAEGCAPGASLWPDAPRSGQWSKWFGRYLRKTVKITDRRKVFHSFRHTFKRMARSAGLPEELHDALTGHVGGGVGRAYGRGYSLAPLASAMDKIVPPIDLSGLRWG